MSTFSERMTKLRKQNRLTQAEVAERLNVSFQAVSQWERGETSPDIDKLPELAKLYHVTTDWLLSGNNNHKTELNFEEPLSERLFNEERMYTYIKTYATMKHMPQTLKILPYVREKHAGQFRMGKEAIPYVYHPLLMACHALALGLDDDVILSAALLHDVCEDCNVTLGELPADDEIKLAVSLLTKNTAKSAEAKHRYFEAIAKNPVATMVKLLDRCCNVSGMAAGFSHEKLVEYINETEKYFYPLMQQAKTDYPQYSNQIFLIKYHMTSVVNSLKYQLAGQERGL